MERIVIVTDGSEIDQGMIELLKPLFPECEIQIVSRKGESSEVSPKDSFGDSITTGSKDGNHDKNTDR
jgi:hypothetical protein